MITLKTLPEATAQEVFDHVAKHLFTQNKRSVNMATLKCCYRSPDGLKCAAGSLMTEEEYNNLMGHNTEAWVDLVTEGVVTGQHCILISDLQYVHDRNEVEHWGNRLKSVAKRNSLEYKQEEYMAK